MKFGFDEGHDATRFWMMLAFSFETTITKVQNANEQVNLHGNGVNCKKKTFRQV
jgi:hypothetical protein